jgi:hypothetical protein
VFFKREWRQFSKQIEIGSIWKAFCIQYKGLRHARIHICYMYILQDPNSYYNYDKNMHYWISSRIRFLPFLPGTGSPCLDPFIIGGAWKGDGGGEGDLGASRREGLDTHQNQDKTCRNCKPCPDLYTK